MISIPRRGRPALPKEGDGAHHGTGSAPLLTPDQLGETGSIAALASIAGSMEDAQGRFNLRNLVESGQIVDKELESLRRLASLLELPTQTADLIAERMLQAQGQPAADDRSDAEHGKYSRRHTCRRKSLRLPITR